MFLIRREFISEGGLLVEVGVDQNRLDQQTKYFVLTRFLDVVLSFTGLILLSPVMLIISMMIKLDDPTAPVFFSQKRIGYQGKEFKMYKFRTMVPDAEERLESLLKYNEVQGAMFKMKQDPRVTPIGHFLRNTSLDELPQLWNVLKGEMSLVGPRPPLPREVELYSERDMERLLVKPGCTGLWQVSGRNALGFDEMVNLDIQFINELSLRNYFKIIWKTFAIVLSRDGAY